MAAAEVAAAAAGGAVLLYLAFICQLSHHAATGEAETEESREEEDNTWPEMPPATWIEAAAIAARTVMFTCGETLGRWPIGDIAFGIKHRMKLQGSLQHEYTGDNCVQLKGNEILGELNQLLKYLNLCLYFSKKSFPVFMEFSGYNQDQVLLHKSKARLMKPAFTIVRDDSLECFLIIIRGATTTTDRLTAASGAEVPFHHIVLERGKVIKLVLGHAHCGMLAAARWIAGHAIPCLLEVLHRFPRYNIKIMGHSMGAGVGAILTYILREHQDFSLCTCVSFAPAACITWELAESGKDFITSLVNRDDVVPSFSKVSADKIRTEVMATSWINEITDQIHPKKLFGIVNCHVNNIRSHVARISRRGAKVADADSVNCTSSSISEPLIKQSEDTTQPIVNGHSRHHYSSFNESRDELHIPCCAGSENMNNIRPDQETPLNNTETVAESLESKTQVNPVTCGTRQFYPPGKIFHMVALPSERETTTTTGGEIFGIYETPRHLYGKIRLAPDMVKDHYMPSYMKTLEVLIENYGKDESGPTSLIDL